MESKKTSGITSIFVPCGVSSFFEICDSSTAGKKLKDQQQAGARGGGFIIKRGTTTRCTLSKTDSVVINGVPTPDARTSLRVIELMRRKFALDHVRIDHKIEPPIGSGFGTSGSGALGAAIALSEFFGLNLTLAKAAEFAHAAEIESLTGLGTVISVASGIGGIGLVTEPGGYGIGKVDTILADYDNYVLVCASFGPIVKSSVILNEASRSKVNKAGRKAMNEIQRKPTMESLLSHSWDFAQETGLASQRLSRLVTSAIKSGAIGATQNMIGDGIHCLVRRSERTSFLHSFSKVVPAKYIFETDLYHGGPKLIIS